MNVTIYARLSFDRHGDELGVARQEEECRAWCGARGWTVREVFSDNSISATKGTERPGFEALLTSRPEAIVVWHVDRLVRVTRDLERVIEIGCNIHSIHTGYLDLSTPAGRAVARTVTAWSSYEGEIKAERQIAANLQAARSGRPYTAGIRPFGYADDHVTVIEKEADAVRDGVSMVLSGDSLGAVARRWNDAGLVSPRSSVRGSKGWTVTGVKKCLTSARYAGLRTYRGEVMGVAQWPAIIAVEDHYALVAVLTDPNRFSGGPRTGRTPTTLLSGIALCGVCGETVGGRGYRGAKVYGCSMSHTRTPREVADKRAGDAVLARVGFPGFLPSILASQVEHGDDSALLRSEVQTLRDRLDGLALAYASGTITLSQMTAGTEAVRSRLEEVESKLSGVTGLPPIDPVTGITGLIDGWSGAPLRVRRAWIRFIARITLNPARGRHSSGMTTDDHVTVDWNRLGMTPRQGESAY